MGEEAMTLTALGNLDQLHLLPAPEGRTAECRGPPAGWVPGVGINIGRHPTAGPPDAPEHVTGWGHAQPVVVRRVLHAARARRSTSHSPNGIAGAGYVFQKRPFVRR